MNPVRSCFLILFLKEFVTPNVVMVTEDKRYTPCTTKFTVKTQHLRNGIVVSRYRYKQNCKKFSCKTNPNHLQLFHILLRY